ncbi:translational GTPase TypA [Candidatus Gracilibacteria bacterium CG17_big_fil_post_rev_8_21_14_2_50_48_13]|nr:MAG: translational GTPase TypA [Candidatus Gracilibacteria bacterium CG17_big_fil_post_rev_8_21_14_2_50_48_13]
MDIRNIAIIAHVDHGKTTLVDALLKQGGAFRDNEEVAVCVMDSNDLERERGITIYAKNTSILWKDTKINIVDTPGHADFGSEVERILRTVDSVLLLVDAYEGPMPQTRFVLKKSLELGLKPIVLINKIDKPMARPDEVVDMVFDLFVELGATDEQLEFDYMYTIGRDGIAKKALTDDSKDLTPLYDLIMEKVPVAKADTAAPLRMQPSNLGYDNYLGRLAIGRIYEGTIRPNMSVHVKRADGTQSTGRITKLFTHQGLQKVEVQEAYAGDIVVLAGLPDIYVGETICADPNAEPLPAIKVDPPTVSMYFMVNNSPFAGREGKFVTTRHIKDRLDRELETNVGLKVESVENSDSYIVSGRGEMHLSVLIETMRREGFELQVSRPEVIFQYEGGKKMEPIEFCIVEVPEEHSGSVIEKLGRRKGQMKDMKQENGLVRMEYEVPTRGLLGFRSEFLIDTRGNGIMYHSFLRFEEYKGTIPGRLEGSQIAGLQGTTSAYSLWTLQERGPLFIGPGVEVYEGMIIGEHAKGSDLVVNPTKGKQLTNVRASGSDDAIVLTPPLEMNLEIALEYIQDDEYVEVTPSSVRLRKKYLKEHERKRDRTSKKD